MIASILSASQIQRLHNASLAILDRTGVHVPHAEMLVRFADAGARVDWDAQRVRIPAALVERSLATAGKAFTLYGRNLAKTAAFGTGQRNYNSIAGEASWVDVPGGPRRYATLDDVCAASRLGDALPEITLVGAMADPHEIPPAYRTPHMLLAMLRHTTKPVHFWFHDRTSTRWLVEMMIALRGSEEAARQYPVCYPFLEPISPLRFPFHGIDLLFETARLNLPVPIGPMAQMGLSAPATLAGTMAQENAEILAGICITQLIQPGMPVCYGGICHAFDMGTTQLIFSGPEQAIFGVAMTQHGKSYGLPVYINVGLTDAKRPDAQAGMEAAATLILGAAAGADIFGHMGISGVDQATLPAMLVLQCEVISYVESVLRDVEISDETLGLDVVEQVGPGGTYIDQEHTFAHFRRELWFPTLLDRSYYDAWRDAGALPLEERCTARAAKLMKTHVVEPLDPALERTLCELVAAAEKT
jgi:trimethylamine--corrinoid protein Co-methyltransferase